MILVGDSAEQVIAVEQSAAQSSNTFGTFLKKFTSIFHRTRFTRYEKLSFHKMNTKDHLHGENWLKDKEIYHWFSFKCLRLLTALVHSFPLVSFSCNLPVFSLG